MPPNLCSSSLWCDKCLSNYTISVTSMTSWVTSSIFNSIKSSVHAPHDHTLRTTGCSRYRELPDRRSRVPVLALHMTQGLWQFELCQNKTQLLKLPHEQYMPMLDQSC